MKTNSCPRRALPLAGLIGLISLLAACTHTEYRCPLEPGQTAQSPSACAGMQEAMAAARAGEGGKTSVLLDDKGRRVPIGVASAQPAVPRGSAEPYRDAQGNPIYEAPKVFRTWTRGFVDADGNLHEGHHSWFATPGRWAFGNLNAPGEAGGSDMLQPSRPTSGVPTAKALTPAPAGAATPAGTPKDRDAAALQNLSKAAANAGNKSGTKAAPAQGSVTAPAVQLSH